MSSIKGVWVQRKVASSAGSEVSGKSRNLRFLGQQARCSHYIYQVSIPPQQTCIAGSLTFTEVQLL